MEETGSKESAERVAAEAAQEDVVVEAAVEKQVYLRTVYPLNPGIPHFVDVPGGW